MSSTEIRLLGPLEAFVDDELVALGGSKQRAVLALLALNAGRVVASGRLVDMLWGAEPPPTAATALHGHISHLRRLLGAEAIQTRAPGYLLEPGAGTDLGRFERLVAGAVDEPVEARAAALGEALGLWRGPALADLAGERGLTDEARRLNELRLGAREELFDAELVLGRHVEVVPELEGFARDEPYRERPVGQLMLALYRGGRQADALEVYRRFRRELSETLGLEPGAPLRELEHRMLAQDPGLAPPVAVARAGSARRLPLTAVAVAFTSVAEGAAEPDTEAFGRVAATVREAIRLALERHGAAVQRGVGGRVIGAFGDPLPHADDALRGLLAARAAIAAVRDLVPGTEERFGIVLDVCAGIASGESFSGESRAFDAALALCEAANPGEVAVDDVTRAAARGREFRLDRPLIGRDRERELLQAALARSLRERRGGGVVLIGPAGIGKSRLAADLLASLDGRARVVSARCLSYGDGIALWPVVELVRAAAGLPQATSRDVARQRLLALVGDGDRATGAVDELLALLGLEEEAVTGDELSWAIRRLFEGVAADRPAVVYVDDLRWAAPPVLEVVSQLVQSAAPVFVVATTRSTPSRAVGELLELAPLEPGACEAVVAALLGSNRIATAAFSTLVDLSDGNPFFLEELVRDLRSTGRLCETDGVWDLAGQDHSLPRSIQTLLAERLDQLPAVERDVLMCASVMGRSFPRLAFVDLLEPEIDADAALEALAAAQLVQPTTAEDVDFEFRHLLIRDVAYASLPLERRAELHVRHVAWLDRARVTAPLVREAVAVYHLDQAHRSLEAFAPGALELARQVAPLAERAAALGRSLLDRGDAAAAAALLGRARELDAHDAAVAVELGRAQLDVGDFAAADTAFAAAEHSEHASRARLGRLEVMLRIDPDCDHDAMQRGRGAARDVRARGQHRWHRRGALCARLHRRRARPCGRPRRDRRRSTRARTRLRWQTSRIVAALSSLLGVLVWPAAGRRWDRPVQARRSNWPARPTSRSSVPGRGRRLPTFLASREAVPPGRLRSLCSSRRGARRSPSARGRTPEPAEVRRAKTSGSVCRSACRRRRRARA